MSSLTFKNRNAETQIAILLQKFDNCIRPYYSEFKGEAHTRLCNMRPVPLLVELAFKAFRQTNFQE